MGKIAESVFRDWLDGDIVNALDYKQEREILRTAINDTHDRFFEEYEDLAEKFTDKLLEEINQATNNANFEAAYAKDQGDYAKNKGDYALEKGDRAEAEAVRLENTDVSSLSDRLDGIEDEKLSKQGGEMSGDIIMGSNKLRLGNFYLEYNPSLNSLDFKEG